MLHLGIIHNTKVKAMTSPHRHLFHLTCKASKYFFIGLFGVGIIGLIASTFGIFHLFVTLLPWLWIWFLRLGILIACLFTTVAITESLSS